jgi:serine/threonine protein kinase
LSAYDKLKSFENSVKKICDFSCYDDKTQWISKITEPITFCNNKKDKLHFIVLEYIENAGIEEYFNKNPSNMEICSFFLQIMFSIIELAYNYRLEHGDLNSGNILVCSTDKIMKKYFLNGKEYRIKTFGFIPVFIDFGRSKNIIGKIYTKNIFEDIFICLSSLMLYIKNIELKQNLTEFILKISSKTDLELLIKNTREFFDKV